MHIYKVIKINYIPSTNVLSWEWWHSSSLQTESWVCLMFFHHQFVSHIHMRELQPPVWRQKDRSYQGIQMRMSFWNKILMTTSSTWYWKKQKSRLTPKWTFLLTFLDGYSTFMSMYSSKENWELFLERRKMEVKEKIGGWDSIISLKICCLHQVQPSGIISKKKKKSYWVWICNSSSLRCPMPLCINLKKEHT